MVVETVHKSSRLLQVVRDSRDDKQISAGYTILYIAVGSVHRILFKKHKIKYAC